jgi:hypothetical protein
MAAQQISAAKSAIAASGRTARISRAQLPFTEARHTTSHGPLGNASQMAVMFAAFCRVPCRRPGSPGSGCAGMPPIDLMGKEARGRAFGTGKRFRMDFGGRRPQGRRAGYCGQEGL